MTVQVVYVRLDGSVGFNSQAACSSRTRIGQRQNATHVASDIAFPALAGRCRKGRVSEGTTSLSRLLPRGVAVSFRFGVNYSLGSILFLFLFYSLLLPFFANGCGGVAV